MAVDNDSLDVPIKFGDSRYSRNCFRVERMNIGEAYTNSVKRHLGWRHRWWSTIALSEVLQNNREFKYVDQSTGNRLEVSISMASENGCEPIPILAPLGNI